MDELVNKDEFYEKFYHLLSTKRQDNCFYLSKLQYSNLIKEVLEAKQKTKGKQCIDYRRLKRFDVVNITNEDKLIVPVKPGETNVQFYVNNDELFDIIQDVHIRCGHVGRTRMLKELQQQYKNVTYEVVMLYLNMCKQCQQKHRAPKKISRPHICVASEFNTSYQLSLINMHSQNDGDFQFIMAYQDIHTKFIQLRPLKTKTTEEIANKLLHIFLTFGAPNTLHSNTIGADFLNKIIAIICSKWKEVHIEHNQKQFSVEVTKQDIKQMLNEWMENNKTTEWSEGLYFVQFAKNSVFCDAIMSTPYEAVFGCYAKKIRFQHTRDNKSNTDTQHIMADKVSYMFHYTL